MLKKIYSCGNEYIFCTKVCDISESEILENAIVLEEIDKSNNIFVYCGTYKRSNEKYAGDYKVRKNDPEADYIIYQDIEKSKLYSYKIVPISHCADFEKNNLILLSKRYCSEEHYDKIRKVFFETAIKEGQEKAIEKVKKMK